MAITQGFWGMYLNNNNVIYTIFYFWVVSVPGSVHLALVVDLDLDLNLAGHGSETSKLSFLIICDGKDLIKFLELCTIP